MLYESEGEGDVAFICSTNSGLKGNRTMLEPNILNGEHGIVASVHVLYQGSHCRQVASCGDHKHLKSRFKMEFS